MRKFNFILIILGCMLFAMSCSDDNKVVEESPLKVVESNVVFTAAGGNGTIKVTSTTPVASVTSSDDWCKVSVSGSDAISVNVGQYAGTESRNSLVTITDKNSNEVHIAVSQSGFVFSVDEDKHVIKDAEGTYFVPMVHSLAATAVADSSWLKASVVGDSLVLKATANTTGDVRSSYVRCECSGNKDSVLVVQGETSDILGNYYFAGTLRDGSVGYIASELVQKTDGSLAVDFPALDWEAPVAVSSDGLSFNLAGGTYLGTYTEVDTTTNVKTLSYIYTVLWDTDQGYIAWSPDYSFTCDFDGTAGSGIGVFRDNGSWSGYVVSALRFEEFTKQEAIGSNRRKVSLLSLIHPFMQKMKSGSSSSKKFRASAIPLFRR